MSKSSPWDAALDAAQVRDPAERDRLHRALTMARDLLQQFKTRVVWVAADFDDYSSAEKRLPLSIAVNVQSDKEYGELELELAEKVFGPVLGATRISMPLVDAFFTREASSAVNVPDGTVLYSAAA